ncbi:flagellar motor stator protein MotA [Marivita hallyeonensis]|uniref:Chemotaxis protein MotA n=1 Tax=Marivita hallyeonensis TaxID=996342 RepID=A0A1M5UPQ8_9RHOB|nr:flagellar motor stator protein MotA [Marivita hallyeonensis]SHH64929.1 chemotaxis protein MotA [Marivita hallyeonensis]
MITLFGIVFTFLMVFGGYMLAGGKLSIILKSLPFEMMMIGGAAVGSFAVANSLSTVKQSAKDLTFIFKGGAWTGEDYQLLLEVLYQLLEIAKKNPVALETHIDDPHGSELFARFPKLLKDHEAVSLVCDTFRASTMNFDDPNHVEEVLEKKISEIKHHRYQPVHALQGVADALPALGIVAAVLGVIKTMSSIDQPPEVLGKLIGGALVGTFLGVFLAYCLVAPFASKMKVVADEDINFYEVIKTVLISHMRQHPPKICLEVARQNIPHHNRPEFEDLDASIRNLVSFV